MNSRYIIKAYDAAAAIRYAHIWSLRRNPRYLDFSNLGGDCTNFTSQCLYAGSGVMNYTPIYGWYYISASNRTASWTGARFLYKFLTTNEGTGPFAREVTQSEVVPGDIISFSRANGHIYHSPFIVEVGNPPTRDNILVAAHTFDVDYQPLSTYEYDIAYFLHIEGVRISNGT
jgi:hypothetical protein